MPKIPIYNLSTNIQPQSVGSTAVVEIPQSATSGAIASIADTTSKTLNDIAKFGSVIVENESKRIIASENISYKTQLDTAQKNIQLANPLNPEIWMEELEKVKTGLLSEIANKNYKYDFIKKSVTNQLNLDFLPLRNSLYDKYLTKTKTLNLLTFEEQSMVNSNSVGSLVSSGSENFNAALFSLQESLANYATYGGADKSYKLAADAYKNAFRIGLEDLFKGNQPYNNFTLTLEQLDAATDKDVPGISNLQEIIKRLDDVDARTVLEKFTDNEYEEFSNNERINNTLIKKQKVKKNLALYQLYTTQDDTERQGAFDVLNSLPLSAFEGKEKKIYTDWYNTSNTEDGFDPPSNPLGNDILTAKLKNQINQYNITFTQLQEHFPDLSAAQQTELLNEFDGKQKTQKSDFRKKVQSAFGLGVGENFVILGGEEDDANTIITSATSLLIDKYNDAITANPNLDYKTTIPKLIAETKAELKVGIRQEIVEIIDKSFKDVIPGVDLTPENLSEEYRKRYDQLSSENDLNELTKLRSRYRDYKDLIKIYDSYATN